MLMGGGGVAYWGAKGWVVCFWRGDRVVVEMGGGGDGWGGVWGVGVGVG